VPTWKEFAESAPELASRVQALFTSHKHHTMATVRRDGSPRISGTEVQITDGQLRFGMMSGARRGWDLRRDPRLAIHTQGIDPLDDDRSAWPGEAKISGSATEVNAGAEPGGDYQVDITEVVLTYLDGNLRIDHWSVHRGIVGYTR
jgi:hypothetical protein